MKVLVIGSGGREHALAWKLAQSPRADRVYVAPGNGGTTLEPKVENVPIKPDNRAALVDFAAAEQVGLTLVGPEAPLISGVVDAFEAAGLRCLGPRRGAARLEGSKAFTKDFLARHHIPTARYRTFTEIEPAVVYIKAQGAPLVVKADGLAGGKGVVVAQSTAEAIEAAQAMLLDKAFGEAGRQVIIEEFLTGEEASFMVLTDGKQMLPLAGSQDHKARDDGDTGPNTGGMGAYSPAPVVTETVSRRITEEIIGPTLRGMAGEGTPYTGFLYAGLMLTEDGVPKLLEYNCRLGDPEAQPIIMRLRSDLLTLSLAALEERLHRVEIEWDSRAALGVVMAAKGYPGSYASGDPIQGLDHPAQANGKVFHAGTRAQAGRIVTAGGRVLCACGLGESVTEAQTAAYALAGNLTWENVYYRTDIGHRAIKREASDHGRRG